MDGRVSHWVILAGNDRTSHTARGKSDEFWCAWGYHCEILCVVMIGAVILSAGASSRMGRPKALLPVGPGGETFLARIVGSLRAAGLDQIAVVVGADATPIRAEVVRSGPDIRVVENPDPSRGQLSSLVAALDALDRPAVEALLVIPVDQPLVAVDTIRAVIAAYLRTRPLIVRPACSHRHGHPVIFDRSMFHELRSADLAAGARAVVARHAGEVVDVPVEDEGAFVDIDTPEDYERWIGPDAAEG
jgi:molybdenum cofactor cytidylyltransferase